MRNNAKVMEEVRGVFFLLSPSLNLATNSASNMIAPLMFAAVCRRRLDLSHNPRSITARVSTGRRITAQLSGVNCLQNGAVQADRSARSVCAIASIASIGAYGRAIMIPHLV